MAARSQWIRATIICLIVNSGLSLEKPLSKIFASTNKTDEEIQRGIRILEGSGCNHRYQFVGGGEDADAWEFPWMALLVYSDGLVESVSCGGTLLSSKYVLTAAHCIYRTNNKLVKVRLYEHDIAEDIDCVGRGRRRSCRRKVEIEIEEAIYHQDWNFHTGANDIGIIRMVTDARYEARICLPYGYYLDQRFAKYQLAGWGTIETGMRARILQKADVTFDFDVTYCQRTYRIMPITDKHICLQTDNRVTSCTGDSGGPLFGTTRTYIKNHVQFGIMSYGSSNCGSTNPNVFTKVEPYVNWIFGNLREEDNFNASSQEFDVFP